jgi:hypothetical protein
MKTPRCNLTASAALLHSMLFTARKFLKPLRVCMLRALVLFVMLAVWTSPLYSLTESKFPPGSNAKDHDSFGSPNYDSVREKQILRGAVITGHRKRSKRR